jgi:transposase InsO family protein
MLNVVIGWQGCEIFNTDQGSLFTTPRFTQPLLDKGIKVSMDGRGRALDNIFVERLWRSVKAGSRYFCEILFWASQPKQAAKT